MFVEIRIAPESNKEVIAVTGEYLKNLASVMPSNGGSGLKPVNEPKLQEEKAVKNPPVESQEEAQARKEKEVLQAEADKKAAAKAEREAKKAAKEADKKAAAKAEREAKKAAKEAEEKAKAKAAAEKEAEEKAKAKAAAEKEAEAAAEVDEVFGEDTEAEEITLNDCKAIANTYMTKHKGAAGRDVVVGAFKAVGASNFSNLMPDMFAEFVAYFEKQES